VSAAHLLGPPVPVRATPLPHIPGCTGKVRHDSYRAYQRIMKHNHNKGTAPHIYACRHCGGWHTSSMSGPNPPGAPRDAP